MNMIQKFAFMRTILQLQEAMDDLTAEDVVAVEELMFEFIAKNSDKVAEIISAVAKHITASKVVRSSVVKCVSTYADVVERLVKDPEVLSNIDTMTKEVSRVTFTNESLVLGDFNNSSVEVTPFVELENCCDFAVESIDFFNSCTTESTYESAANVASMMNMESNTIALEADAGEQKVSHLKKFIDWVKSMFKAFFMELKGSTIDEKINEWNKVLKDKETKLAEINKLIEDHEQIFRDTIRDLQGDELNEFITAHNKKGRKLWGEKIKLQSQSDEIGMKIDMAKAMK